jgi:NAD(P)-dependent dehydrogenase (short-subunit alcohol dehydrogenase family)/acyl carrier protein
MDEVLGLFESKDLRPLAHRVFPAASVAEALRYMGQAKHVGKLIISMQDSWGLQVDCGSTPKPIDANGSYIVTGGLGGLGLAVAERLVQRGARHLALVGRSGPSTSAQTAVEALRRQGAEVMICQADITERRQTQQIITSVQHSMGPLRGIVHAAMVLDDAPIEHLNEERMWRAMAPKVLGAWNLHALTLDIPLDFFVLFSSIASIVGNPGQANYVAGNTFLDTLAYFRRAQNLPALAVNWGAIGEVGHVAKSPETAHRLERLGVKAIPLLETLDTLDELMFGDAVQITVAQVEWKTLLGSIGSRTPARYGNLGGDSGTEAGSPDANVGIRELLDASEAALPSLLESYIRDLLARAMATSPTRIDTQQSLRNLGIDSLIAVEARNRINTDLGLKIPLATVMQSENIKSLAAFVAEQLIESKGGEQSKRPDRTLDSAEAPLTGVDAAHLLERIDQMTDEEIERHLTALQPQGQA